MNITVGDIEVEVQRKRIKNMYLRIKPPDGRVIITAPQYVSIDDIIGFAVKNIDFIKSGIDKYKSMPKHKQKLYVSGENIYIWGKKYKLELIPGNKNSFILKDNKVLLIMKAGSTSEERKRYIKMQYRRLLSDAVTELLPVWENITGLKSNEWHIKDMKTRWGTCNPEAKRIWFSLMLAEHPKKCLEYIILHELAHLKVRNHGADFEAVLDRYMPAWRDIKRELNAGNSQLTEV